MADSFLLSLPELRICNAGANTQQFEGAFLVVVHLGRLRRFNATILTTHAVALSTANCHQFIHFPGPYLDPPVSPSPQSRRPSRLRRAREAFPAL